MRDTRIVMGMPITIVIEDDDADMAPLDKIYGYFTHVDNTYSTYKETSEISRINRGLPEDQWSDEMQSVLALCRQTRKLTKGYFNINHHGTVDPSGLVKGWAINNAATMLHDMRFKDFYIEAGGDIQVSGTNAEKRPWLIGIRNPFNRNEIVKTIATNTAGVATSGTYIRGQHIYDPHQEDAEIHDVMSLTVIGPSIYEADRFATAAFAMGKAGIDFIESFEGLEGYMIDADKQATMTSGFEGYVPDS